MDNHNRPLGRIQSPTTEHIDKYRFAAVAPQTVAKVELTMALPNWHWQWDQGAEGACVGFGSSMERSITNMFQAAQAGVPLDYRYDPIWLWNEAKMIDEFPDTNPGDSNGTSVNAAYRILREKGHRRVLNGQVLPTDLTQGVSATRWATTVDEMRTAISMGLAISIGIPWYERFDKPDQPFADKLYVIGAIGQQHWGKVRGGHDVCIYGASDSKAAFIFKNSWGKHYPLAYIPYEVMTILLNQGAEVAIVTDR